MASVIIFGDRDINVIFGDKEQYVIDKSQMKQM